MMRVFSNIRRDLALRNATVYAQWLGILSAISFILVRAYWTIAYAGFGSNLKKLQTLGRLFDMIFFPLCLFLMETPPSLRRWRLVFGISLGWCYARSMLGFFMSMPALFRDMPEGAIMFFVSFMGIALYFSISANMVLRGESEDFYSSRSRTLFYMGYTFSLVVGGRGKPFDPPYACTISFLWFLHPKQMFALKWWSRVACCVEVAEIFSALAALAYFVAWWAGHDYVFTRTLGGPGVELMPRVSVGLAPRDESIGQDEGRIMLT
ncbi:hypothetical protein F4774DRAFT_378565 [Daldinia eschscholtzii]|nr:hypothetical protein F4774DRAFT_378565 [Daldinia eschscholtzii]